MARRSVGVLGGGQLGQMLALAGHPLGIHVVCLDPSPDAPAGRVTELIAAEWNDEAALAKLSQCDVVTYEFESIPVSAVDAITARVHPSPRALAVAQDRLHEKTCFSEVGIPTPRFAAAASQAELERAVAQVGAPCVVKTRRLGYDGKGQRVLRVASEVSGVFDALGGVPLIVEAFVRFERELSILAVRGAGGQTAFYPLVENHHEEGMLRTSWAPAPNVSAALQRAAEEHARRLLARFDYVGVLALELFETGGELWANEIAPRVHNSGHFSIEGAATSQFENHLRAVLGLPLGKTDVREPCAMVNLIGSLPEAAELLAIPECHLHDYGKTPRARRKVGHVTVRAPDRAALEARVNAVMGVIRPSVTAGSA